MLLHSIIVEGTSPLHEAVRFFRLVLEDVLHLILLFYTQIICC